MAVEEPVTKKKKKAAAKKETLRVTYINHFLSFASENKLKHLPTMAAKDIRRNASSSVNKK